jgi:hypothetical protein
VPYLPSASPRKWSGEKPPGINKPSKSSGFASAILSPKEAIEEAGHETVVIGDQANSEVVGKHGTKVAVDVSIADAKPEDFDGLLYSLDHL